MKIVKAVTKVGNTAGVLVPREWLHGTAEVKLVNKPLNVLDVFHDLSPMLSEVKGVYVVGSYARREQTNQSDVDLLVITTKTTKKIKEGRYESILISEEELERQLSLNAIPLIPMLREAKPLLNTDLLETYRHARQITMSNLHWHLDTTETAMNVVEAALQLDQDSHSLVSDEIAYSLVLRLRGVYIVNSILRNKRWSTKGLLSLIRKLTGTDEIYAAYLRSKTGKRRKRVVTIEAGTTILEYIRKQVTEQRKWVARRGLKKALRA